MTLRDFHGGSIPSNLPLPSAPGTIVRPLDRPGFDRQGSWGNPMGSSDHRLFRPSSAGAVRNYDDKTPFLSPIARIGRNFNEDERKPLDGVLGPRRTISDESIHALPIHTELKPDYSSTGKLLGRQFSPPASQLSSSSASSHAGRAAESTHVGVNSRNYGRFAEADNVGVKSSNLGGNSGVASSGTYPNAWEIRKEASSTTEPLPGISSGPNAASKLAHASALEKVSSGRSQSSQPMHHPTDVEVIRHTTIETEFRSKGDNFYNKSSYHPVGMVGRVEYHDAMVARHAEGGGRELAIYERARSPMLLETVENNPPSYVDGVRNEGKFGGSELESPVPSEQSERPKLNLLLRHKPLESLEPPAGYNQGYQQPQNSDHLENGTESYGNANHTNSVLSRSDSGNRAVERPKLNLKPQSQPLEQFKGNIESERKKMLEKIGLQGGNNWVVDGTHCQGCSSQFTFIYRKHHCRRCGGLFCNACTRQRMVLCGHGDSPVRICEPCKKLEEAARFEMRHGHENITRRGGSKLTSRHEDEVVNQILGNENKELVSSGECSMANMVSALKRDINSASFSNVQEVATHDEGDEIPRSISVEQPNQVLGERESASPEELRQQALDEKKRYKILKAEGKYEEALKAFKRGKELERQAGDLELLLRKNRKKALSSSNMTEIQKTNVDSTYSGRTNKLSSENGKEKVDLAAELRELGWSDMDLRGADKKPASISLEGELSNLLGEISPKTNTVKGSRGIDKTQVIAHKKKALTLKREGKLAEAKEELKRAKVLEKQLEEQEFLADAEDSDDELSALIRAIDGDKQDSLMVAYEPDANFDFDNLIGITDDLGVDINFEVTDKDVDDPEIATALKSLGWTDEVVEKDGNNYVTQVTNSKAHNSAIVEKGSIVQSAKNPSKPKEADVRNVDGMDKADSKLAPKSRLMVQKELLGLKKRALALRREGKLDEADEELKKGKVLEQQLEEMDNASKVKATQANVSNKQSDNLAIPDLRDDGDGDVTEQDMHDPTYLSLLRNLGWKDEDDKNVKFPPKPSKQNDNLSEQISDSSVSEAANSIPMGVSRSKGEIQRELLGLKRKALAFRRQGQIEEAEEVLKMAKVSEAQLAEMEVPKKEMQAETNKHVENEFISNFVHPDHLVIEDLGTNDHIEHEKIDATVHKNKKPHIDESDSVLATVSHNDQSSVRQEILALKRKAVALKREGKLAEAREELRQAKLLENNSDPGTSSSDVSNSTSLVPSNVQKEHSPSNLTLKPHLGRDRFKLQQESLSHKRLALKLRREGRIEESEAEFQLAKALEAQLDDSAKPSVSGAKPVDDVGVEDFLDPQLLFALKEIGFEDASTVLKGPEKPEPIKSVVDEGENSSRERIRLEAQIKAEKVKAINLKRAGKQAEALDALRCAKVLEKKLSSLAS